MTSHGRPLELVYVTAPSCRLCEHGSKVLDELQARFAMRVREVDLLSDEGRQLVAAGRVAFPPALFADGRLLAHGRLSTRALGRELVTLGTAELTTDRQG